MLTVHQLSLIHIFQRLLVLAVSILGFTFATSFFVDGGAQAAVHAKTLKAHTGSLAGCEFGINQVFDTQWGLTGSPPSQSLDASSFRLPYNSSSGLELTSSQLASTDYFQFVYDSGASDWELVLFDSSGSQLQVVDQGGTFLYMGPGFLFYNGGNFYGTLITTQGSYAYGGAGLFPVSITNPNNSDVSSFNSCQTSIIPLAVAPSAPLSPKAISSDGQATVSWNASATAGSSAITSYTVSATSDPTKSCTVSASSSFLSCTVYGLTNGQVYSFSVTATNSQLTSVASSSTNTVIPATNPSPPNGLVATSGKGQVQLSWSPTVFTGSNSIIDYTVNESGATVATLDAGTATSLKVTGLTAGDTYFFSVTATNDQGLSSVASSSVQMCIRDSSQALAFWLPSF